jgi:hypothetical protein
MIWHGYDWTPYNASGLLGQVWHADQLEVNRKGRLVFHVGPCAAAGAALLGSDQVYGRWTVRFRMNRGAGSKYVLLLWPKTGARPEVDFAESSKQTSGEHRVRTTATFHRTMTPGSSSWWRSPYKNFTRWHTASVVWQKALLVFRLDGRTWARYTGSDVPSVPMHLAIQTSRYAPGPRTRLQISDVGITP